MTTVYSLKFETFPTWRARSQYLYPPGTGWPSYIPRHWVRFCRLLRLAELRWRYSTPPPHEYASSLTVLSYNFSARTPRNAPSSVIKNVFICPLPSDACPSIFESVTSGMRLLSRFLAMGVCVTICSTYIIIIRL
jgi:hypothetical protein